MGFILGARRQCSIKSIPVALDSFWGQLNSSREHLANAILNNNSIEIYNRFVKHCFRFAKSGLSKSG